MSDRERDLADLLRAANAGDAAAYRRFLDQLSRLVRAMVRARLANGSASDAEDIVQETLLAVHLKRQTWDERLPIGPWVATIARNKLIDHLRRRGAGRRIDVPIDDYADILPAEAPEEKLSATEIERLLGTLSDGQRGVVRAITVEGLSIRETAERFGKTEGAVRVTLHRGLAALSAAYRESHE